MDSTVRQDGLDITKALGRRIRQLRQSRTERITQEGLAERAEISVSFLSMIERGERAPHIDTLARLARALEVSISELFLFAEDEPESLDPMLKPLAEFVRTQSLTRRDVDRLLGVARAMFDA
ncbi:MAG TPA: XRE family transcriptional regulator [Myxococcales bacterium]|jgi:transcriptional regulator with XRE-family HTH domain|nr:XRE family transcriptional regulator [Myxococcales bacterium]